MSARVTKRAAVNPSRGASPSSLVLLVRCLLMIPTPIKSADPPILVPLYSYLLPINPDQSSFGGRPSVKEL